MESSIISLTTKLSDDELEEYQKVFSIICESKTNENDEIINIQFLNENSRFTSNNVAGFVQKMKRGTS